MARRLLFSISCFKFYSNNTATDYQGWCFEWKAINGLVYWRSHPTYRDDNWTLELPTIQTAYQQYLLSLITSSGDT